MTSHDSIADSLATLERKTFQFFVNQVNSRNGLALDKSAADAPCSIAVVGLVLSAYPIGVERGYLSRAEAVTRTLTTLRFFRDSTQSDAADATGYKGFYYHFLDMVTGKRVWNCELSTVDSAFLLAGMLTAASYFAYDTAKENEIRTLARQLYERVDWQWAWNGGPTLSHGWTPESGFLPYRWQGYDEALFLYLLALGSPTYPLAAESYAAWTSTYEWRNIYGRDLLYSGPLFTHQVSHLWVDFRGIQDEFMHARGIDYFENTRQATYVHREYAIRNPQQFEEYGENCWGLSACNGPGWITLQVKGRERRFFDYVARGAPDGPDDGTITPWAAIASIPFAPEIVIPALRYFDDPHLHATRRNGYRSTFNATFPRASEDAPSWTSPWHLGINQWPMVLSIENYRSGLLWALIRRSSYFVRGLRRAGFTGGWLEE